MCKIGQPGLLFLLYAAQMLYAGQRMLGSWPPVLRHGRGFSRTALAGARRRFPLRVLALRNFLKVHIASALLTLLCTCVPSLAQTPVTTWHYDNQRTSANTTEFLLTPANVNIDTFGKLATHPVDGLIVGQALYLPGINIPGQGARNVVYVATMHDSVYAFDADSPNSAPLWMTSILTYSPPGATPVPTTILNSASVTAWTEVGIVSTPVIDSASGTLYLVAETYENGDVVHRLHALDVATGQEKLGGPTTIAATYTLNGVTSTFTGFFELNRPGLLLVNGHIYIAFGSNCCNAFSQGWVMSYNATTLQQEGAFDAEPGKTLASIWQKDAGLSADSSGNIYAETGEGFYAPGTNLSISVLKLSQTGTTLTLADWFTPFDHQFLSDHDRDLAQGVLILPDQPGPVPHELIAVGKQGTVYVMDRDNMGHLCSTCTTLDTQIVQELTQAVGFSSGTPVHWNNTVYFTGLSSPVMAFTLNDGLLMVPPLESEKMSGGGHGLITSNGDNDGILWFTVQKTLHAMDARTLGTIYVSNQAANDRDALSALAHFATPIVADGKVFVGTTDSLVVFGLFPALSVVGGSGQSGKVGSTLPLPLVVQAVDPYTQNAFAGVTVTFSDGGKGGSFNPSTAVTDQSGSASSFYTLPNKAGSYSLTASATGYAVGHFTETGLPAAPDLTTTSVTNPPATAVVGSSFAVTDTVQNIGGVTATASTTRYWLSATTTKNGGRLLTGSRAVPPLGSGATSTGTATVTVTAGTASGTYFLLACADDTTQVTESNEKNNCKASATQVVVSGPDLIETAISNPPTTVAPGDVFSVTDTVQNVGNGNAAATITRYFLSTTASKTANSILLKGTRQVPSLTASASSSGSATVTVPSTLASGTYFLLACSDNTKLVPETNEGNNCKASAATTTH